MTAPLAQFAALAMLVSAVTLAWLLRPLFTAGRAPRHRGAGVALAVLVPAITATLYALLGDVRALDEPDTPVVQRMVARLAAHLRQQPGDAGGWRLLARSYASLQRSGDALAAYTKLVEIQPGDADALADLAEASSIAQGGRLDGEPVRRAREALALDPAHPKALAIAANEAAQRKAPDEAIALWERMKTSVPAGSPLATSIDAAIAEARIAAGRASRGG